MECPTCGYPGASQLHLFMAANFNACPSFESRTKQTTIPMANSTASATRVARARLPTELLIITFEFLKDDYDVSTLARITQSCKEFRDIAQPMLYASYYHCHLTQSHGASVLASFFSTILENSQLAAMVKTVIMTDRVPPVFGSISILRRAVRQLQVEDGLIHGGAESMPLLLPFLSNLQHLSLCCKSVQHTSTRLQQWIDQSPTHRLPLLETVELHQFVGEPFIITDVEALLTAAPNIKRLRIRGCRGVGHILDLKNLSVLQIEDSLLEVSDISNIIRTNCRLETLIYRCIIEHLSSEGIFDAANKIVAALGSVRRTLKCFELDIVCQAPVGLPVECIETLRCFPALEVVRLDQSILWMPTWGSTPCGQLLSNILPPSLRKLQLSNVHKEFALDIMQFAEECVAGSYPNMEEVIISGVHKRIPPVVNVSKFYAQAPCFIDPTHQDRIKSLFALAKVRFGLRKGVGPFDRSETEGIAAQNDMPGRQYNAIYGEKIRRSKITWL